MVCPDFDTIISGAGISRSAPSALPSGDELARVVWLSLFDPRETPSIYELCNQLLPALTAQNTGIRLEHLVEVLSRSMPLEVLVRAYDLMGNGRPNAIHEALASLPPHEHFTLNVDTLLEDAGMLEHQVTHLHGQWDRPEKISTTVGQYLAQLPPDLHHKLTHAVKGRDVVVVGYSGRDFDVFPVLQTHPPRYLRWLVYPGHSLAPDVAMGLELLEREHHCTVDTTPATIFSFLGMPEPSSGSNPVLDLDHLARQPRRQFTRVPLSGRALGAARVMFEIGAFAAIEELAGHRPCVGADLVALRKIRARAKRQHGHNVRALGLLVAPPRSKAQFSPWLGNGNEIAYLISRAGLPIVGTSLDRLMLTVNRRRRGERSRALDLMLKVRLGRRASVIGDLRRSRELLESVVDAEDVTSVLGPAGEADAITWLLDALKGSGDYRSALRLLPRLQALTPYTNLSQRAYALWQVGAVNVLCDRPEEAMPNLELADLVANWWGDERQKAWIRAITSDALRDIDSARSGQVLIDALAQPPDDYLARQFLHIQAAEHARHTRDFDDAEAHLEAARRTHVPGRIGPRRSSLNYLATRMIEVMILGERDVNGNWPTLARRLLASYEKLGAHAAAADVQILLSTRDGSSLDTRLYRANGWDEQASRAEGPWDWRRPWRVIA